VVITIFFVWVGLNKLGAKDITIPLSDIGLDDLTISYLLYSLVIGLTIYNGVVIGEILRSGMEGLPRGQREAADAIGLSTFQTIRLVLLPQAYRIMLPALISQLVVVLKDTSLGFIITYEEILRVAGQTVQVLGNGIQTYVVIGAIYIAANYTLSKIAEFTQRRMARGRKVPRQPGGGAQLPPASLGADTELPAVAAKGRRLTFPRSWNFRARFRALKIQDLLRQGACAATTPSTNAAPTRPVITSATRRKRRCSAGSSPDSAKTRAGQPRQRPTRSTPRRPRRGTALAAIRTHQVPLPPARSAARPAPEPASITISATTRQRLPAANSR
jgi:ABC-type amino acid transport system permease subunit